MTTTIEVTTTSTPAAVPFDYGTLDDVTRSDVQLKTGEIKERVRRSLQDILEIGERLISIKSQLGHGSFGQWLTAEFPWGERTAQGCMRAAETFKSADIADLSITPAALLALAAPSVPETARAEAVSEAKEGKHVGTKQAAAIIAKGKATQTKTVADPVDQAKSQGLIPDDAEVTVVHPDPAPDDDEPEPAPPVEMTDAEWLETLPARARLNGIIRERFDADAVCYRECDGAKESYRAAIARSLKKAERLSSGRPPAFVTRVRWFLRTRDPAHWLACESCGGKGQNAILNAQCVDCHGGGYHI